MTASGERLLFKRAVYFSLGAHLGFLFLIILAPHLPRPSRKGLIHHIQGDIVDQSFPGRTREMGSQDDQKQETEMGAEREIDRALEKEPFSADGHFLLRPDWRSMGSVTKPTASTPAFLMMSRVSIKKP